jgi:hypothetical protein
VLRGPYRSHCEEGSAVWTILDLEERGRVAISEGNPATSVMRSVALRAHLTAGLPYRSAYATALTVTMRPSHRKNMYPFTQTEQKLPEVCRRRSSNGALVMAGAVYSILLMLALFTEVPGREILGSSAECRSNIYERTGLRSAFLRVLSRLPHNTE